MSERVGLALPGIITTIINGMEWNVMEWNGMECNINIPIGLYYINIYDVRLCPHARPPAPKRTLHLVLCLVGRPLRHLRIFPPSVNPSRHRPRLCLGDIPALLAAPPPRFLAPDSGYGRRVYRIVIQHVLRSPSRVTHTLRRIHRAHRHLRGVLWHKRLFDDARTHLARNLRARKCPPRRQYGEYGVV